MFNRVGGSLALAAILGCMTAAAEAKALTSTALEAWLERYGAAWEARDASAAGRLFTTDARYYEMPFEEPKKGRFGIEEYWGTVTADQRDVKFESKVIAINGNTGVAHWSAKFRLESTGATVELDGVFVLEFDSPGLCSTLREWWHLPVQAPDTKATVEAATSTFHQALRMNDLETFMSFITDDVVIMPPGEATVRGKGAVRAWYKGFLSQFRTSSLSLDDREVFVGDGWAVEVGTYQWGLAPSAGGAPVLDRGSYMQVWKRQPNGQWRFAREVYNSSLPPAVPR